KQAEIILVIKLSSVKLILVTRPVAIKQLVRRRNEENPFGLEEPLDLTEEGELLPLPDVLNRFKAYHGVKDVLAVHGDDLGGPAPELQVRFHVPVGSVPSRLRVRLHSDNLLRHPGQTIAAIPLTRGDVQDGLPRDELGGVKVAVPVLTGELAV